MVRKPYRAILSSDWNECLAPCGPFDFLYFVYPHLEQTLSPIFRQYTANEIPLSAAIERVERLLPRPITQDEMDGYLDASFATYAGLGEWMDWCREQDILFMINTTGMQGYFQRIFAKGLLPPVQVLSAHPAIRFDPSPSDPQLLLDLRDIGDKPRNTASALQSFGIDTGKIILMGDSGGDGPHFEWGARAGALLIGSMTKATLRGYCDARGVAIHVQFALESSGGTAQGGENVVAGHFMQLVPKIEEYLARV